MFRTGIRIKLVLWFFAVGVVPLALLGIYDMYQVRQEIIKEQLGKLEVIARDRVDDVDLYIRQRQKLAETTANIPGLVSAFFELQREKEHSALKSPEYIKTVGRYTFFDQYLLENLGFYDLFLIDLDGNVLYTDKQESDFGTNLLSGPYSDTDLAHIFKATAQDGATRTSRFDFYEPTGNPAAFVATPLRSEGEMVGVLALQYSSASIFALASNFTGLGSSGEIVIARWMDRGAAVVAPLRHDPDAAFKRSFPYDDVKPLPIHIAIMGGSGRDLTVDYRGRDIIAAWEPIPILNWGLVAKIDADEALRPITDLTTRTLIVGTMLLILLFFAGNVLASSLTQRIQRLQQAAQSMALGETGVHASVKGRDELALLTESFNTMSAELQLREQALRERNQELSEQTQKLRISEAALEKQRSQLEETNLQLAKAAAAAQAANQAKSLFLANMSHEIRTPINAIVGFNYCLENEALSKQQRHWVKRSQESTKHLLKLVDEVLDLARIESGNMTIECADFDLSGMLERAHALFAQLARDKGLELVLDHDARPVFVNGDETHLHQVLINLLGNAVKFTQEGSIKLRARLAKEGAGQNLWRFEVIDTGIGILPDKQAEVFGTFIQADASITRKFGGAGLGLAIAQKLVKLMGGEVQVESTPGQGSHFHFELWLKHASSDREKPRQALDMEQARNLFRSMGEVSVLVVEDNAINREIAATILSEGGLRVQMAENGAEALEILANEKHDIVLMDMQMPVMDGIEATRELRKREASNPAMPRTRVLAMTANAYGEHRDACEQAGMDGFIAKPVEPGDLYATIYNMLSESLMQPGAGGKS